MFLGLGASMEFDLGKDSLKGLRLQSGNFSALIQYEASASLEQASLWVGAFTDQMPEASAHLAVGPRPLTDPAQSPSSSTITALADYRWVEALSDGKEFRIVAVK